MNSLKNIVSALDFAARKHRDQRRKDHAASPYINHPISLVSILVIEAGISDPNVIVAAILHDTIEDTDTTPEEIERHFGQKIKTIVEEVTDDRSLSRDVRKELQVKHASHLSTEAALVKLADKIANLRDLQCSPPLNWSCERKQDYFDWAEKVVKNINDPHPRLMEIFSSTIHQNNLSKISSSSSSSSS
jgi:guanosine-3',5'-bis(diphosphate) 3'-pyrophosphohydrolase